MKKQRGVTLITLILTIILMLILISTGVTYSRKAIDNMKLNEFSSELQIVEKKLGIISGEIKMGSTAYNSIGINITSLPTVEYEKAKSIINKLGLSLSQDEINDFVLLKSNDLETIGISKIKQDVLANYNLQKVISYTGITISGITYYSY